MTAGFEALFWGAFTVAAVVALLAATLVLDDE